MMERWGREGGKEDSFHPRIPPPSPLSPTRPKRHQSGEAIRGSFCLATLIVRGSPAHQLPLPILPHPPQPRHHHTQFTQQTLATSKIIASFTMVGGSGGWRGHHVWRSSSKAAFLREEEEEEEET